MFKGLGRWWSVGCALSAGCVDTGASPTKDAAALDAGLVTWDAPQGAEKPPVAGSRANVAHAGTGAAIVQPMAAAPRAGTGAQPSAAGKVAPAAWVIEAPVVDSGVVSAEPPVSPVSPEPPQPEPEPALPAAPVAALSTPQPGELVISELMIDPKTLSDNEGEWFELFNASDHDLTLSGCLLDDGSKAPPALATELQLQPGAYAVIARQADPGFTPHATASFSLSNTADSLAVRCGGVEIDRVSYDKSASFPLRTGASLQLDAAHFDATANDAASAWCSARDSYGPELGTPGAPNVPCQVEEFDAGGSEA